MSKKLTILTIVAILTVLSSSARAVRTQTFDTGLGPWVEFDIGGNIPTPCWSNSNNAGGPSGPGEFGGIFTRGETGGVSPYIGDTSIVPVDHETALPLKFTYTGIDVLNTPPPTTGTRIFGLVISTRPRARAPYYMARCSKRKGAGL